MAYMTFIAMLVVAYRDGTVITVMRQGMFYFAPIILWKLFATGLAVPRAVDLRAAYYRRQRKAALEAAKIGETTATQPAATAQELAADTGTDVTHTAKKASMAHLPPAVRRRREKLIAQQHLVRS